VGLTLAKNLRGEFARLMRQTEIEEFHLRSCMQGLTEASTSGA
jgi:hypothetical protein